IIFAMHEGSDDSSLVEKLFGGSSPGCTSCAGDQVSHFHVLDSVLFLLMRMIHDILIDVMYHPHCQGSKSNTEKGPGIGKIEQGSRADQEDDRCGGRRPYPPH